MKILPASLGDVMKESIRRGSRSCVREEPFGMDLDDVRGDIDMHVPRGRPRRMGRLRHRDGDSDGVGADQELGRGDVAMTGEVTCAATLGNGGLKEKLLAALRGGIPTVR